ncbi:MAG: 3-oxoacyl-[acyl-carrier-protein] synthase III C-terminal domain-containing protein [Candidatus Paceibacterota bacterium]
MTNEDILEMIATQSNGNDISGLVKFLRRALRGSGSNTRRWLGLGETSLDLTAKACEKAMSGLGKGENIDLIICAGVYPELIEPSTANLVARELGLYGVECFDMKEACDGWMKAVKLAHALIANGMYRRIMVVNGEFVMTSGFGIYPELFNLSSPDQLEWRFPAYTLGEAAAATILGPGSGDENWRFSNITRNDLFDLCSITPSWYSRQKGSSPKVAKDKPGLFTSYGGELRGEGFPIAVNMFKNSWIKPEETDILFTHSSSKKDWDDGARAVGLSDKIYDIYATHGNVVSAAIPAAMATALEDGTLKRGQRVAAWVASAGMSFSIASFTF